MVSEKTFLLPIGTLYYVEYTENYVLLCFIKNIVYKLYLSFSNISKQYFQDNARSRKSSGLGLA